MNKLDRKIWAYVAGEKTPQSVLVDDIRRDSGAGHPVATFEELVAKTAELGFRNRQWFLLYRGQNKDYATKQGAVSLFPAIYRDEPGKIRLRGSEQQERFAKLDRNVKSLQSGFATHFPTHSRAKNRLRKHFELAWAILQHYGKAATPYLDFSASLRVAASFAAGKTVSGFLYVIGVPYPSGTITHAVDEDLKLVRLQAACPPTAKRPHFQEGFMVGSCYIDPSGLRLTHNVSRRLITKFQIQNRHSFWTPGRYEPIPSDALYPEGDNDFSWV